MRGQRCGETGVVQCSNSKKLTKLVECFAEEGATVAGVDEFLQRFMGFAYAVDVLLAPGTN